MQTWNKDLAREVGESMGQEFSDVKNYGWYGPNYEHIVPHLQDVTSSIILKTAYLPDIWL